MEDSSSKKILISILGLVIIVAAGFLLYKMYPRKEAPLPTIVAEEPKTELSYYPDEQVPGDIPIDMPFEQGAPLIRNESVSSNTTTQVQYARGYFSKKTVKENHDIYLKYFTDNGWKVLNNISEESFANITAKKEGRVGEVSVSISENNITEDITVQIISYK